MYDIYFVDYGNPESEIHFKQLKTKLPHIQKTRFFGNLLQTLHRISGIAQTEYFWAVSSTCQYDEFDFEWEPVPWENTQLHAFCADKQKDSETFLVNTDEFSSQYNKPIEKLEHYTDVNWHTEQKIKKLPSDVFFIDYENEESVKRFNALKKRIPHIQKTRFFGDYMQILHRVANMAITDRFWVISSQCDYKKFDFNWGPDYWERDQLHIFSSTKEKYIDTFSVNRTEFLKQQSITKLEQYDNMHWHTDHTIKRSPIDIFFINHRPENGEIFDDLVFKQIKKEFPNVRLIRFFSDNYLTTLLRIARISKSDNFWVISSTCDYKNFNFNWRPKYWDNKQLHVFSSRKHVFGDTFFINKDELLKQYDIPIRKLENYVGIKWHVTKKVIKRPLDIFLVDYYDDYSYSTVGASQQRLSLKTQLLDLKNESFNIVRFFDTYLKTLHRIAEIAKTNYFWILSSHCKYDEFDFEWGPTYWNYNQLHVFSSNKQKYGETFLVNRLEFLKQYKNLKKLEHYTYIKRHVNPTLKRMSYSAWFIDHGNPEADDQFNKLKSKFLNLRRTRFFGDYKRVLHRLVTNDESEWIWALSSICDYNNFDFEWGPKYWDDKQLHVFCTEGQKFGDTFLLNKKAFMNQLFHNIGEDKAFAPADYSYVTLAKLDQYKDIKWHRQFNVKRLPYPTVYYGSNSSALETVKKYNSRGYDYFWCINENASIVDEPKYNPGLWEKPKLHVFKRGADVLMVPRGARQVVSNQLYDYNNILYHKRCFSHPQTQDIVFISYGEKNADLNHNLLIMRANRHVIPVKRVDGIKGQVNAYKEAARIVETDHFFAVFAKTKIHRDFHFLFQPDRLKEPTHYIFNSKNTVNGLEYGHAGVILYNTKMVLEAKEWGVDFTTSFANQPVPILSCINNFNTSAYETWRTAFRECLKLQSKCIVNQNTVETNYRLDIWTTKATGDYAKWSLRGANDGVEYAESGEDMMKAYDREWLEKYFTELYVSVQNPVLKTILHT